MEKEDGERLAARIDAAIFGYCNRMGYKKTVDHLIHESKSLADGTRKFAVDGRIMYSVNDRIHDKRLEEIIEMFIREGKVNVTREFIEFGDELRHLANVYTSMTRKSSGYQGSENQLRLYGRTGKLRQPLTSTPINRLPTTSQTFSIHTMPNLPPPMQLQSHQIHQPQQPHHVLRSNNQRNFPAVPQQIQQQQQMQPMSQEQQQRSQTAGSTMGPAIAVPMQPIVNPQEQQSSAQSRSQGEGSARRKSQMPQNYNQFVQDQLIYPLCDMINEEAQAHPDQSFTNVVQYTENWDPILQGLEVIDRDFLTTMDYAAEDYVSDHQMITTRMEVDTEDPVNSQIELQPEKQQHNPSESIEKEAFVSWGEQTTQVAVNKTNSTKSREHLPTKQQSSAFVEPVQDEVIVMDDMMQEVISEEIVIIEDTVKDQNHEAPEVTLEEGQLSVSADLVDQPNKDVFVQPKLEEKWKKSTDEPTWSKRDEASSERSRKPEKSSHDDRKHVERKSTPPMFHLNSRRSSREESPKVVRSGHLTPSDSRSAKLSRRTPDETRSDRGSERDVDHVEFRKRNKNKDDSRKRRNDTTSSSRDFVRAEGVIVESKKPSSSTMRREDRSSSRELKTHRSDVPRNSDRRESKEVKKERGRFESSSNKDASLKKSKHEQPKVAPIQPSKATRADAFGMHDEFLGVLNRNKLQFANMKIPKKKTVGQTSEPPKPDSNITHKLAELTKSPEPLLSPPPPLKTPSSRASVSSSKSELLSSNEKPTSSKKESPKISYGADNVANTTCFIQAKASNARLGSVLEKSSHHFKLLNKTNKSENRSRPTLFAPTKGERPETKKKYEGDLSGLLGSPDNSSVSHDSNSSTDLSAKRRKLDMKNIQEVLENVHDEEYIP